MAIYAYLYKLIKIFFRFFFRKILTKPSGMDDDEHMKTTSDLNNGRHIENLRYVSNTVFDYIPCHENFEEFVNMLKTRSDRKFRKNLSSVDYDKLLKMLNKVNLEELMSILRFLNDKQYVNNVNMNGTRKQHSGSFQNFVQRTAKDSSYWLNQQELAEMCYSKLENTARETLLPRAIHKLDNGVYDAFCNLFSVFNLNVACFNKHMFPQQFDEVIYDEKQNSIGFERIKNEVSESQVLENLFRQIVIRDRSRNGCISFSPLDAPLEELRNLHGKNKPQKSYDKDSHRIVFICLFQNGKSHLDSTDGFFPESLKKEFTSEVDILYDCFILLENSKFNEIQKDCSEEECRKVDEVCSNLAIQHSMICRVVDKPLQSQTYALELRSHGAFDTAVISISCRTVKQGLLCTVPSRNITRNDKYLYEFFHEDQHAALLTNIPKPEIENAILVITHENQHSLLEINIKPFWFFLFTVVFIFIFALRVIFKDFLYKSNKTGMPCI